MLYAYDKLITIFQLYLSNITLHKKDCTVHIDALLNIIIRQDVFIIILK